MFNGIPKKLAKTCCLLRGINPTKLWQLMLKIIYLYREFSITTNIDVVVKEYIISFYYKDNQLLTFKTTDLNDASKVIENIKDARAERGIK